MINIYHRTCVIQHLLGLSIGAKFAFIVKERKGKRNLADEAGRNFTRKFRVNFWRNKNTFSKTSKMYLNVIG